MVMLQVLLLLLFTTTSALWDAAACHDCVAVQGCVYGCISAANDNFLTTCRCGASKDACDHGVALAWDCSHRNLQHDHDGDDGNDDFWRPLIVAWVLGVVGLVVYLCVRVGCKKKRNDEQEEGGTWAEIKVAIKELFTPIHHGKKEQCSTTSNPSTNGITAASTTTNTTNTAMSSDNHDTPMTAHVETSYGNRDVGAATNNCYGKDAAATTSNANRTDLEAPPESSVFDQMMNDLK